MTFNLYPEDEAHWWSRTDHRTVVDVVARTAARTVLEFGPGTSTLSLLEGGAQWIDSCEDDPHWFAVHCERIEDRYPERVRIRPYTWSMPLHVAGLLERYDLALIDGPIAVQSRPAVVRYCLNRCRRVLLPLEEGVAFEGLLRRFVGRLPDPVEFIPSGPLAGTFALIGERVPPC